MRWTKIFSIAALLGSAFLLTYFHVPTASSQGTTLIASHTREDLSSVELSSPVWADVASVQVPLTGQQVVEPRLPTASVRSVTARALHDGDHIAFLVEWQDETLNEDIVGQHDFRDSVALQFPVGESQPFFCMGQAGGDVNIWHWKADWQADMAAYQELEDRFPNLYADRYPFANEVEAGYPGPAQYADQTYVPALEVGNLMASPARPSPVEDLVAGGYGGLTAQSVEAQNVQGTGEWQEGRWRVLFIRNLESGETDDVQFTPGKSYALALAAWDGASGERNGEKSTSQWITVSLERGAPAEASQAERGDRAEPLSNREAYIFVILPIAGTFALFLGAGVLLGIYAIVAELRDRRS